MATMESRPPFECPSLWFNVERATGILQRILLSSLRSVMSLKQLSKRFLCLLNVLALPTLAKFIPSTLQIFFFSGEETRNSKKQRGHDLYRSQHSAV